MKFSLIDFKRLEFEALIFECPASLHLDQAPPELTTNLFHVGWRPSRTNAALNVSSNVDLCRYVFGLRHWASAKSDRTNAKAPLSQGLRFARQVSGDTDAQA